MEPTTTLVVDAQPLQRLKGGVGVGHGGNSAGCRGGSDWRDSGNAGETPADIARPYLLTHSQFRRLHSLGGTPSRFASQFLDRHEMPTSKRRDRHNNEPFSGSSRLVSSPPTVTRWQSESASHHEIATSVRSSDAVLCHRWRQQRLDQQCQLAGLERARVRLA